MTSLAAEKAEQALWRLRPRHAGLEIFDQLLANEFVSADEQQARQTRLLRNMVRYAALRVPYYRDMFRERNLSPDSIGSEADLPALPPVTRHDIQERTQSLMAPELPKGQAWAPWTRTSGTTGQPVRVRQTQFSQDMFHVLKQRELRWFRFHPDGTLAGIRASVDLNRIALRTIPKDQTLHATSWPYVGFYFQTGPFLGFSASNPVDAQIAWLEANRPDYLIALAAQLEHLALACQDRSPPKSLKGIQAISQQLTPEMRRRIESSFGLPVNENYGLNEIGIVATRCPEGGRYHVHAEQCLVEIVGEDGKPCAAGKAGRILVTSLVNVGMPLLRYDADDLAEVVARPCPCGRTLPSFGAITGRYRRIAALPPGTWDYWLAVVRALEHMPAELARPLRQYQLHQFRGGAFELRLAARSALAPAFIERIRAAWSGAAPAGKVPAELSIREMEEMPVKPGAKFQDFTSDLISDPQTGETGAAG